MTKQELLAAVRKHAVENYTTGGWDYVVESYEDQEILDMIGDATTVEDAIARVGNTCGILEERRFDVQASSGELDYYGIEEGPDGNLRRKKEKL